MWLLGTELINQQAFHSFSGQTLHSHIDRSTGSKNKNERHQRQIPIHVNARTVKIVEFLENRKIKQV
jgi:hypothetical protein